MEIMDIVDIETPTGGDWVDDIPPYVGGRYNRPPCEISYTEEVAGSSPVLPTLKPPSLGGFVFIPSAISKSILPS